MVSLFIGLQASTNKRLVELKKVCVKKSALRPSGYCADSEDLGAIQFEVENPICLLIEKKELIEDLDEVGMAEFNQQTNFVKTLIAMQKIQNMTLGGLSLLWDFKLWHYVQARYDHEPSMRIQKNWEQLKSSKDCLLQVYVAECCKCSVMLDKKQILSSAYLSINDADHSTKNIQK